VKFFPYEFDNIPQIKEAFTLKKVFDNQSKSFRGALDDSIDDLDIEV
jgi:hypothetical protein